MSRLTMVPVGKEALRQRRRQALLRLAALMLLLAVAAAGLWWMKDRITGYLVKVTVELQAAKMGQLAETRELPGWVIRDERIVHASMAGHVQRLVKDGDRVRVGAPVVRLKGLSPVGEEMGSYQDLPSPRAGLIVYRLDGLEEVLNPRVLDELSTEQLNTLAERPQEIPPDGLAQAGQGLFKVIDNVEKAYFLTHYDVKDLGEPLVPSRRLTLALNAAGPNFYGKVLQVRGTDDVWAVIQLVNPPAEVFKRRQLPLQIVDKIHKGILLSKDTLIERNGEKGVWLAVKNRAEWRPIQVKATIGDQVIIDGVAEGELVVQNPALLREGQEIK
ncbi:hypothetical protein HM1_2088 [Heliomicrobium modesticaldum Ice1]|uniref:RND related barrel-sandwich hybrid domain-containing protein n=1 Tax=Heliobacterium modesticaldum (strain ATCC 51547 / Ice1) TaxID=498761 RepID=B0TGN4_HELMI|nr:HlyD family efflux transporter periplasmic adaptor subunit [Heliomicrobium modesticaldum]ABZ84645.1 hypothetical protein HM1_2088 [Heliomicrobium modesticaldum Ice1]